MEIFIYSEILGLEIQCQFDEPGSQVKATCLAAIAAIEECKKLGLKEFRLLTDSLLLERLVKGKWQIKDYDEASKYVPTISKLLFELRASIGWCRASANRAIRYSPLPKRKLVKPIQAKPKPIKPKQAKQKKITETRKGAWDEYSRMDKAELIRLISSEDLKSITKFFRNEKFQLVAVRQRLRGFSLDEAIQKAKDNMETARKFAMERYKKKIDGI